MAAILDAILKKNAQYGQCDVISRVISKQNIYTVLYFVLQLRGIRRFHRNSFLRYLMTDINVHNN